jgi:hypothetical protein
MHYFDTRGIHRIFKVTPTGDAWVNSPEVFLNLFEPTAVVSASG